MAEYFPAPKVKEIADELIEEHHPHLESAPIRYLFRDDTPNKNGREVWGTAQKIGGHNAFLVTGLNEPFFLITISHPIWTELSESKRRALVDHELMHCKTETNDDGEKQLKIIGHDFEGFNDEIDRYGLWRDNAKQMAAAMQPHLPFEGENTEVEISSGGKAVKTSLGKMNRMARDMASSAVPVH